MNQLKDISQQDIQVLGDIVKSAISNNRTNSSPGFVVMAFENKEENPQIKFQAKGDKKALISSLELLIYKIKNK